MGNSFTEVTRSGYGSNIMRSIGGAFVGFFLFLGAFPLLWWNEGRTNWADVAKTSKVAAADKADPGLEGQLVAVTAPIQADEEVGDPDFLKPGQWISLRRDVEMYAWVEKKTEKTEKEVGGSSTTTTTYDYSTQWTDSPKETSSFKHPEGHQNPPLAIKADTFAVKTAKLGAWTFAAQEAQLPSGDKLTLTQSMLLGSAVPASTGTTSALAKAPVLDSSYLFVGAGSVANPQVGDVRMSYDALARGVTVTLFGKATGSTVTTFLYQGEEKFFRALKGSREEAIAELALEHKIITWILRVVGFLMMWFGLSAVLGPLAALTDLIPALGNFGRFMIGLIMFPISLFLTTVTVIVSMILHSLIATLITGVVLTLGVILAFKLLKKRPAVA